MEEPLPGDVTDLLELKGAQRPLAALERLDVVVRAADVDRHALIPPAAVELAMVVAQLALDLDDRQLGA
jgi:hypothetical protein